jgi:hypothetical protein
MSTTFNPSDSLRQRQESFDDMLSVTNIGESKELPYNTFQSHQNNSIVIQNIHNEHCNRTVHQMKDKIAPCQGTIYLETNSNNAIRLAQQKVADNVIQNSMMNSSVIVILKVTKLYFVWKEISVATNLHNDSTKFQQIEVNIIMLETIVEQLIQVMQTNNIIQVSRIIARAQTEYNQTKLLINNLQVNINESLQRLNISADGQILDGFSNFAATVDSGIQLIGLFRFASTSKTIFAIGITSIFAILTLASVTKYFITQKRLKELQQDMNCLDNLNEQLDQFYELIEDAGNFIQQ